MKDLFNFSITPLHDQLDELCEDICAQVRNGVSTIPLFSMTLVPEGIPLSDKVGPMLEKYRRYKARLDQMNVPSGILVQATIGHGRLSAPSAFRKMVGLTGDADDVLCPLDEGFLDHMREIFAKLAAAHPAHIMVDDDLRLINRSAGGCACPAHLAAFNRLAGTDFTREELLAALEGPQSQKYIDAFVETQRTSVLGAARAMREGIDSVDPSIPGSYSGCGNNIEFGEEIAEIMAGKGNPITIRVNNSRYTPSGARHLSRVSFAAATQIEHVRHKVDVILAETDTCPQNRYSTSAYSLHSHFVASILEGANGAKHWITRMMAFEPNSGIAYRKILSRNRGFYRTLAALAPSLEWQGCRIPLSPRRTFLFEKGDWLTSDGGEGFATHVLERLGLPLYFSAKPGGAAFLCSHADKKFTDDELIEMLKGPVFLASESAAALWERGLGEHLGVRVCKHEGLTPSGELLHTCGKRTAKQMGLRAIQPLENKEVRELSTVFHTKDRVTLEPLFPGVTVHKNDLGGTAVVFCGTPITRFHYSEAFSFLNESRKAQIAGLLCEMGVLPIYYEPDEEVYLRAAKCPDGSLFVCVFNIGLDPIDELLFRCPTPITSAKRLSPSGEWEDVAFTCDGEHLCIKSEAHILDPVCLLLK